MNLARFACAFRYVCPPVVSWKRVQAPEHARPPPWILSRWTWTLPIWAPAFTSWRMVFLDTGWTLSNAQIFNWNVSVNAFSLCSRCGAIVNAMQWAWPSSSAHCYHGDCTWMVAAVLRPHDVKISWTMTVVLSSLVHSPNCKSLRAPVTCLCARWMKSNHLWIF